MLQLKVRVSVPPFVRHLLTYLPADSCNLSSKGASYAHSLQAHGLHARRTSCSEQAETPGVYTGRTIGRDRDHRDPRRVFVTGDSSRPRIGATQSMSEQFEADRPGCAIAPRYAKAVPDGPQSV